MIRTVLGVIALVHLACANIPEVYVVKSAQRVDAVEAVEGGADRSVYAVSGVQDSSEVPFSAAVGFEEEFTSLRQEDIYDPLEGYNRFMTGVNDFAYTAILFPVAKGYRHVLPEETRLGVARMFDNLQFPVRFTNNLLQLKIDGAAEELGRFCINSTLGFLGFFDPARTEFGLLPHKEDFGQTLGRYGFGSGFHIVIPLLGPSNLRDAFGIVTDSYLDPVNYMESRDANLLSSERESIMVRGADILNDRSLDLDRYEALKQDALDLYLFLREAYEKSRQKSIQE